MHNPIRLKFVEILNSIYEEGCIVNDWKLAEILPIQKPGKHPVKPAAYRPISLLSCAGKLMEKNHEQKAQAAYRNKQYPISTLIRL